MRYLSACLWIVVALAACERKNNPIPTESELRAAIRGSYCAPGYRMTLSDSSYICLRYSAGLLSSVSIRESCEGSFELVHEKNSWRICFEGQDSPHAMSPCHSQELMLWSRRKGFPMPPDSLQLPELFDGVVVQKGACGD